MIKIIEDFLPEDIQNNLEELMKNESYFPWYFHSKTVGLGECAFNNNTIETPQLVHQFLRYGQPNSDYFKDTFVVMEHLEKQVDFEIPKELLFPKWDRIKGNCLFPCSNYTEDNFHPAHQDKNKEDNCYTFLYYVNDSDGDTRFWSNTDNVPNLHKEPIFRYTPKKGTGVLFPSETWHCSSNPISSDYRMVINYIFQPTHK